MSSHKRNSKGKRKKAVPKAKSTGSGVADSKSECTSKVKKWLKEDSRFEGHKLKSTADPKKNYY
ncbi:MAG: hypothetical protein GY928_28655 [Colwellia sp.]|nr:hypothetical protein [Colwellia sp.]